MEYKYDIDEVVILDGVVDGVKFVQTEAIVVVQINEEVQDFKYTVKLKTEGGYLHRGYWFLSSVNDYSNVHMEFSMFIGHPSIRSNSGYDCFSITEDIIVESLSKKKKEYDPSQQPWDEGDI